MLWNFLGMAMVGFGSVLVKGCPFRQLIASGQGDTDAGMTVLGMLTGAALVQNWGLAGNAEGTPYAGKIAVLAGLCCSVRRSACSTGSGARRMLPSSRPGWIKNSLSC